MVFLNIHYKKGFDFITEKDLAEQISYWFFIYLLYSLRRRDEKVRKKSGIVKLKKIFRADKDLEKWFLDFVSKARQYFSKREKKLSMFFDYF